MCPPNSPEFSAPNSPPNSDLIINELNLNKDLQNLKVTENSPSQIGGKDGFKIEYNYNTPDNLEVKTILYGFRGADFVYLIQYQAAKQYYFDKDIETFERFIETFRISE